MATYAGFERYEVPSLGAPIAAGLQKRAELEYKESVLKKQLEAKNKAASDKAAATAAKESEKDAKEREKSKAADIAKVGELYRNTLANIHGESSIAGFGRMMANTTKDQADQYIGTQYDASSISDRAVWASSTADAFKALDGLGQDITTLSEAKATGSKYAEYVREFGLGLVPSDGNPVVGRIEGGNIYAQPIKEELVQGGNLPDYKLFKDYSSKIVRAGNDINLQYLRVASGIVKNTVGMDFDKSMEENVMKYGKQETAPGFVYQAGSKEYKKQRNEYAGNIAYGKDHQALTDAYAHFMPSVVIVNKNDSPTVREQKAKAQGLSPKECNFLEMEYKNGQVVPVLSDKQRAELNNKIQEDCDAMAEKKLPTPKEGKKSTVTDEIIERILKGNQKAMASWAMSAGTKQNITTDKRPIMDINGKVIPGSNLNHGYWYDGATNTLYISPKNLVGGSEGSSEKMYASPQPIDLNDKENARFLLKQYINAR